MQRRQLWCGSKEVLRLALVVLIVVSSVVALWPASHVGVAEASVAAGKNDDKEKKEKEKERKHRDDDRGDDFVLNGQVLEIDTRKDPPEMVVGTVDGRATVRVLKTDEIATNGVGVGDYVELTGEKINELLFEATEISVGQRFAGPHPPAREGHESQTGDEPEASASGDDSSHDHSNEESDGDSNPE
jgi:ribosomal protein L12E/L44/L45/RPP1/RPP2